MPVPSGCSYARELQADTEITFSWFTIETPEHWWAMTTVDAEWTLSIHRWEAGAACKQLRRSQNKGAPSKYKMSSGHRKESSGMKLQNKNPWPEWRWPISLWLGLLPGPGELGAGSYRNS